MIEDAHTNTKIDRFHEVDNQSIMIGQSKQVVEQSRKLTIIVKLSSQSVDYDRSTKTGCLSLNEGN